MTSGWIADALTGLVLMFGTPFLPLPIWTIDWLLKFGMFYCVAMMAQMIVFSILYGIAGRPLAPDFVPRIMWATGALLAVYMTSKFWYVVA